MSTTTSLFKKQQERKKRKRSECIRSSASSTIIININSSTLQQSSPFAVFLALLLFLSVLLPTGLSASVLENHSYETYDHDSLLHFSSGDQKQQQQQQQQQQHATRHVKTKQKTRVALDDLALDDMDATEAAQHVVERINKKVQYLCCCIICVHVRSRKCVCIYKEAHHLNLTLYSRFPTAPESSGQIVRKGYNAGMSGENC